MHSQNAIFCFSLFAVPGAALFNAEADYARLYAVLEYYKYERKHKFFVFLRNRRAGACEKGAGERTVEIMAYSFMPSGIHLILREIQPGAADNLISRILKSYTKYYNYLFPGSGKIFARARKYKLGGAFELPVLEWMLHSAPVEAGLAASPEAWPHSSYRELARKDGAALLPRICDQKSKLRAGSAPAYLNIPGFIFTSRKKVTAKILNPFLPAPGGAGMKWNPSVIP